MRPQRSKGGITAVASTFAMTFEGSSNTDEVIRATLVYRSAEPFSARASFVMSDAPTVHWVMSRDLLREGLAIPSGLGDVKLRPCGHRLTMELNSPHGRAVLQGPIDPVIEFVQSIYRLVPEGSEHEHFSIDAELMLLTVACAHPVDEHNSDTA